MSRKRTDFDRPRIQVGLPRIIAVGLTAGLLGVAGMTFGEKVEQRFITGRPNSEVPGLTLARLLGRPDSEKGFFNWTMHYGQGALVSVIRAAASVYGYRGPFVDFMFAGVRLSVDQTLENWTGAGSPPWTWPVSEQVVDVVHKTVYALVTGYICDWWLQ